jgi:hypothetical protein
MKEDEIYGETITDGKAEKCIHVLSQVICRERSPT